MNEFLGLLQEFKNNDREFVVFIDGGKKRVKVKDISGDMVTLYEQGGNNRYDLHYTQVVICSYKN